MGGGGCPEGRGARLFLPPRPWPPAPSGEEQRGRAEAAAGAGGTALVVRRKRVAAAPGHGGGTRWGVGSDRIARPPRQNGSRMNGFTILYYIASDIRERRETRCVQKN